jgi:hypothetical protein
MSQMLRVEQLNSADPTLGGMFGEDEEAQLLRDFNRWLRTWQ